MDGRRRKSLRCIVFTGGGTGGHVFPALAVLNELVKKWPDRIIWIGSVNGMERDLCSDRRLPFYGIPSGKMRRYFSVRNITDIIKILGGFLHSLWILLKERPVLLFSKGGYVSVPPVVAAYILKIPVYTHESDYDPGLATRINAGFAEKVLVSFPDTCRFFPRKHKNKLVVSGNPVRASILNGDPYEGKRIVGCPADKNLLLVLGGSQGAAGINAAIMEISGELTAKCFIVHQMGRRNYRQVSKAGYFATPFLGDELKHILAASVLVVCRAGANSLWELAACGKPSVLIPLGYGASRGDQIRNAEYFSSLGASVMLREQTLTSAKFLEVILDLLDNGQKLAVMGEKAKAVGANPSAEFIADFILKRVEQGFHGSSDLPD